MDEQVSQRLEHVERRLNDVLEELRRLVGLQMSKDYLRPRFVESSPAQRSFVELIDQILQSILQSGFGKVELWIMGYFDQARIDKLKPILAKGATVKIISPELKVQGPDRSNLDALRRMKKNGAEVRIHPMLHARIFYAYRDGTSEVIIGSGDIKSDCLGGKRFDAGIWSDNPDVVRSTVDFFTRVWEDDETKKLDEIVR
jgi:hypothetical protein